jgi:hypothetical protein
LLFDMLLLGLLIALSFSLIFFLFPYQLYFLKAMLRCGWTTVRLAGDPGIGYPSFACRWAGDRKQLMSYKVPRIVGAGHYLSVTGGGGDQHLPGIAACSHNLRTWTGACGSDGLVVDGRDQTRKGIQWKDVG